MMKTYLFKRIKFILILLILGENLMPFKAGDEALPGTKQVLFCGGKNVMI